MPAHKKAPHTARTEGVSIRLDPKLHYLATMAAREQMRTLSSFIEWAVRRTLTEAAAMDDEPTPGQWPAPPLPLWMDVLWEPNEADRFFRLATLRPDLLNLTEQRVWKLYLSHTKGKPSVEAFREFWDDSAINAPHQTKGGK
jgi:hypothetical protein